MPCILLSSNIYKPSAHSVSLCCQDITHAPLLALLSISCLSLLITTSLSSCLLPLYFTLLSSYFIILHCLFCLHIFFHLPNVLFLTFLVIFFSSSLHFSSHITFSFLLWFSDICFYSYHISPFPFTFSLYQTFLFLFTLLFIFHPLFILFFTPPFSFTSHLFVIFFLLLPFLISAPCLLLCCFVFHASSYDSHHLFFNSAVLFLYIFIYYFLWSLYFCLICLLKKLTMIKKEISCVFPLAKVRCRPAVVCV